MPLEDYYRGGLNLKPKLRELVIDRATGLVQPKRGISVYDRPDNMDRFGGAYRVTQLPVELKIMKRGLDPHHFEIVPAWAMRLQDYEQALAKIVLIRV